MATITNSGNPLSSGSIATFMSISISSKLPQLKTPFDTTALLIHACMIAVGFQLKGLGEDNNLPASSSATTVEALPESWNASDSYAFRYAHPQSSLEYIIKVSRLASKALVFGVAPGDDKTASFEVVASEYIDSRKLPFTKSSDDPIAVRTEIEGLFVSIGRIADLAALFKTSVIQKLIPSLWKEGYEGTPSQGDGERQRAERPPAGRPLRPETNEPRRPDMGDPPPARPYDFDDPLRAGLPRRPFPAGDFPPPGFEDEYDITRGPRGGYGPGLGGRRPLNIGDGDLHPPGLGPHDPLRGGIGPGFGGPMGGGMHPSFDDPLFGGRGGGGTGRGGRGNAPPGARYDPLGPGDGPQRGGAGRFPGGPPNPFGGFGEGDFM